MRSRRATISWAASLALTTVLLAVAVPAHAQTKPFDQLVPEDVTDFYVLHNYRDAIGKIKASPYGALLEEPEVKTMSGQIADLASEDLAEFRQNLGASPAEIEQLLDGQIALALKRGLPLLDAARARSEDETPVLQQWMLLMIDLGPNGARAEEILTRALDVAVQNQKAEVTEETFRGHTLRHVSFKQTTGMSEEEMQKLDPDVRQMMEEARQSAEQLAHAYVNIENGILVVAAGTDRSLLEQHIVLRDGGDLTPLSGNALYQELLKRVDADNDYVSFQNYGLYWENLVKNAPPPEPETPYTIAQIVEALGLFGIKGQATSAVIGEEGIQTRTFVSIPAPRKGILKAFEPDKPDATVKPPAFVGADTSLYAAGQFNAPVLWTEVKSVVNQFNPQAYVMIQQQINNPQMPVQVERDVIETLGGQWYIYVPEEIVSPTPPKSVHVLIAIELKDSKTLENTFQKLMALPNVQGKLTTVEFMGKTVYQTPPFPLMFVLGPPAADFAPFQLSMMFVDNKFVVTSSGALARRIIRDSRRQSSPLMEKAEFSGTFPHLVSGPDFIVYLDQRSFCQWIWSLANMGLKKNQVPVDLPKYETLKKYLYISASAARWTEEGLEGKGWLAYPPAQ